MVREAVRNAVPAQRKKTERPAVKMAAAASLIEAILESDRKAPRKQRHRGHYTKRQKSYAKTSLRKPIANEKANAIGFCKPKMLVFGPARPTCTNVPLCNVPKDCLIATACVLR